MQNHPIVSYRIILLWSLYQYYNKNEYLCERLFMLIKRYVHTKAGSDRQIKNRKQNKNTRNNF